MTKEVTAEDRSPKSEVSGLGGNDGVPPPISAPRQNSAEVIQNQIASPAEYVAGSGVAEGISKPSHHLPVNVALSPPPSLAYSSVLSVPQSMTPEAPPQVRRQGRKTPAKVDAPKRRGKKPGPPAATADSSTGQDQNVGAQLLNKTRELLGNRVMPLRSKQETDSKEPTNVNQVKYIL